jgi:hypothetical protein
MTNVFMDFPIIEITEWVFKGEGVYEAEYQWSNPYYIKEADIEKHENRIIIDSSGHVFAPKLKSILETRNKFLSFLIKPTIVVEFDYIYTGKDYSLNDLKKVILDNSANNFHITHNKLMSLRGYEIKINNSSTFKELIENACFVEKN